MFQKDLFKGKRILVTGGGTGLGKAMASRYLGLGAELYICGRRKSVLDESADEMMKEFDIRRKLIHEGLNSLPGIECSMPGGAFYAFPKVIGTGMNGEEFTEKCLQEAGVAMIPGTAFGKFATDHVRFNFATSRENISKAIEKIDKILK